VDEALEGEAFGLAEVAPGPSRGTLPRRVGGRPTDRGYPARGAVRQDSVSLQVVIISQADHARLPHRPLSQIERRPDRGRGGSQGALLSLCGGHGTQIDLRPATRRVLSDNLNRQAFGVFIDAHPQRLMAYLKKVKGTPDKVDLQRSSNAHANWINIGEALVCGLSCSNNHIPNCVELKGTAWTRRRSRNLPLWSADS
jgi:hypothetical protein